MVGYVGLFLDCFEVGEVALVGLNWCMRQLRKFWLLEIGEGRPKVGKSLMTMLVEENSSSMSMIVFI